MKSKFIAKTLLVLSFAAAINFGQVAHAAATTQAIPSKAQPGTSIKYDTDNKMVILKGQITNSNTHTNNSLPKPQPGMTVSYDGVGDPTFIKINGQPYTSNTDNSTTNNMFLAARSGSYSNYGAISWYDDTYGQADHRLAEYDCATDQYADDCPLGTYVSVRNLENGKCGGFHKWDVGNLQGQSEKRIVDIWNPDVFGYIFDIDDPVATGLIHKGYYSHN